MAVERLQALDEVQYYFEGATDVSFPAMNFTATGLIVYNDSDADITIEAGEITIVYPPGKTITDMLPGFTSLVLTSASNNEAHRVFILGQDAD